MLFDILSGKRRSSEKANRSVCTLTEPRLACDQASRRMIVLGGGIVQLTFVIEIVDGFAVRPVARDVDVVVEAIHILQCRTSVSFGVGV